MLKWPTYWHLRSLCEVFPLCWQMAAMLMARCDCQIQHVIN